MNIIQTSIFVILKRFPDREGIIKRIFSGDDNFKTACEDFQQCSEVLRYWNQSTETQAPARRKEYEALLNELEQEIKQRLIEAA